MAVIQVKKFYKGFSTRNYHGAGTDFALYNVECVEQDLMNEIFTIKGERLNMPTYGTRIPLMVFEQNDAETREVLETDITAVIDHDPRVDLLALNIISAADRNTLVAVAKINYLEFNVTKDLWIEVNSQ